MKVEDIKTLAVLIDQIVGDGLLDNYREYGINDLKLVYDISSLVAYNLSKLIQIECYRLKG